MTAPIFYTWTRIEQIVDAYKIKVGEAMQLGTQFYPHALGFLHINDSQNGLAVNIARTSLSSRAHLDAFIRRAVNPKTSGPARLEAAGFVGLTTNTVIKEIFDIDIDAEVVPLLHVEHAYLGVKTWILDRTTGQQPIWVLVGEGIVSKLPPCLPMGTYGTNIRGQA